MGFRVISWNHTTNLDSVELRLGCPGLEEGGLGLSTLIEVDELEGVSPGKDMVFEDVVRI